jgi:hypothetical protein
MEHNKTKLNTYDSHIYSDNIINTLLDIVKSSNKNIHIKKIINMDWAIFKTYRNTLQQELDELNNLLVYLNQSSDHSPIIRQEIKKLKLITTNLKKIIYSLSDL